MDSMVYQLTCATKADAEKIKSVLDVVDAIIDQTSDDLMAQMAMPRTGPEVEEALQELVRANFEVLKVAIAMRIEVRTIEEAESEFWGVGPGGLN